MSSVSVKTPKTPVTKGSLGIAKASVPNVCKMPGPPAPFVPSPLPNIGKSGNSPEGYSKKVKIEGNAVAIQGATFKSVGDMASKGTGGGLVSANTHGPTNFVGPGAIDVLIEGKSVQLLGDPMTNNGGGGGSPPNSSTIAVDQSNTSANAEIEEDPCEAIKIKFRLDVASYVDHKDRKSKDNQSHHVLQDAAINEFCPKPEGMAVLLADSHGGTEHGTITHEHQNVRRDNKALGRGGVQPAATFGELKEQARADLVAGLQGKRTDKDGNPMTAEEAELAAECLVSEAEKKAKKEAEKDNKELNDDTPVVQPGGCFAGDTLVQMASGALCRADWLVPGDFLHTPTGPRRLTRIDPCIHALVEVVIEESRLALATYHRLYDGAGRAIRADALRAGDCVATARGTSMVTSVRKLERQRVYRLGVSSHSACLLGAVGLLAELPDTGPPVTSREPVLAWGVL